VFISLTLIVLLSFYLFNKFWGRQLTEAKKDRFSLFYEWVTLKISNGKFEQQRSDNVLGSFYLGRHVLRNLWHGNNDVMLGLLSIRLWLCLFGNCLLTEAETKIAEPIWKLEVGTKYTGCEPSLNLKPILVLKISTKQHKVTWNIKLISIRIPSLFPYQKCQQTFFICRIFS